LGRCSPPQPDRHLPRKELNHHGHSTDEQLDLPQCCPSVSHSPASAPHMCMRAFLLSVSSCLCCDVPCSIAAKDGIFHSLLTHPPPPLIRRASGFGIPSVTPSVTNSPRSPSPEKPGQRRPEQEGTEQDLMPYLAQANPLDIATPRGVSRQRAAVARPPPHAVSLGPKMISDGERVAWASYHVPSSLARGSAEGHGGGGGDGGGDGTDSDGATPNSQSD